MVTNIVKIFPQDTQLEDMKSIDSKKGYELSDIINSDQYPTYVEETLYTSLNQIRFYYPLRGSNVWRIENGRHILYPTPTGYNLYTIDNISMTTDEEVIQIDAQHYSVNYMRDSAHELSIGRNVATISNINNTLTKSVYVSDDFRLVGEGTASGGYELKDDSYNRSLSTATVGSALVGANSILRKYYGQYLRRNLDHLEAFEVSPYRGDVQSYPIVLGINVRDMDYSIDTTGIYTTAVVSASSIPDIRIEGAESIGGRFSGIGGSIWPTLEDMDDDIMFRVVYKGLPLLFVKTGGVITVGLVKLVNSSGEQIDSISGGVCSYVNGIFKVTRGGDVFIEEVIDPNYFYGIEVYKTNENDPKTYQYLGKNTYNKDKGYKYTTVIPPHNIQYAVRAETDHKGNSVKYVDYEPMVIEEEVEGEVNSLAGFYSWHFNKFKDYWSEFENKKLLEPIFEAKFTIDDMRTLYGQEVINNHIFRVGDLHEVNASEYHVRFNAAITKTKYNGITGELIEIEFGNRQDTELEELKVTNTNKPDKRKEDVRNGGSSSGGGYTSGSSGVSRRTDTKPVITLRESKISYRGSDTYLAFEDNLISAYDKEDGDITHRVTIQQSETEATYSVTDSDGNTTTKTATLEYLGGGFNEDEVGSWMDIMLNGDGDIRDEKDLFVGDMPYEKLTDETGIPRMEWDPPYVTISPDGNESTPSKLICYNGAEEVISEVKWKGQYETVRFYSDGRFMYGNLPDNTDWEIVPKRESGNWPILHNLKVQENFNKDTELGTLGFNKRDVTQVELDLAKESLGHKHNLFANATTSGNIIFETERIHFQRQLEVLASGFRAEHKLWDNHTYRVTNLKEFKREVIDILVGKTVRQWFYNGNYPPETQSLHYYWIRARDGEIPYIIEPYRRFIGGIAEQMSRISESPYVLHDVLTIHFEWVYENDKPLFKRITSVEFDESKLEELEYDKLIHSEPGWERLVFTQPTTKVNDQIVTVHNLLITNGGTSTKNALINKQSIDDAWGQLSPAERKEFEDTYGKEWLFNLRYSPNHFTSDDILYGTFYREQNKYYTEGDFDPFGTKEAAERRDRDRAKKVAERYQQKYNFLVAKEYVVPPSQSGQAIYDRVEKHYLEQAPIET